MPQTKSFRTKIEKAINSLKTKKKILFLTTSNRWEPSGEIPKSTRIAQFMATQLKPRVKIIDVPKLIIYNCEGNISNSWGSTCGLKAATLKDKRKNPTGLHRCWASINNPEDELWKISKELFKSDCVIFFGSVRWGQMNACYQKLIERLTWIESTNSTLKEGNIVKKIQAGMVIFGHNWHTKEVLKTQKKVLKYFGFSVEKNLCLSWQFTSNDKDESDETYKKAALEFEKILT